MVFKRFIKGAIEQFIQPQGKGIAQRLFVHLIKSRFGRLNAESSGSSNVRRVTLRAVWQLVSLSSGWSSWHYVRNLKFLSWMDGWMDGCE